LTLLIGTILGSVNAQYSVNKIRYDHRAWEYHPDDPHNPAICGVVNLFVPGVGQMIAGEGGRGAAFLVGTMGCFALYGVGAVKTTLAVEEAITYNREYQGEGLAMMGIGLLGAITLEIWSIVDAVRVAKVNNLAWRDKNNQSYRLDFEPYIAPLTYSDNSHVQVGVNIAVRF